MKAASTPSAHTAQRGLSMVELMVGVAVALIIVAAAATVLAGNLRDGRQLLLEARLAQDLRTAADVIARDLRRAGHWANATDALRAAPLAAAGNPYAPLEPAAAAASDAVRFAYSRDPIENDVLDHNEQFGFRLRAGAIEMQLGAGNWQALTDITTLVVTAFDVTSTVREVDLQGLCASACAVGDAACPPRQQLRSLAVVIQGRLAADARVTRAIRSQVRVRNDALHGACEG